MGHCESASLLFLRSSLFRSAMERKFLRGDFALSAAPVRRGAPPPPDPGGTLDRPPFQYLLLGGPETSRAQKSRGYSRHRPISRPFLLAHGLPGASACGGCISPRR